MKALNFLVRVLLIYLLKMAIMVVVASLIVGVVQLILGHVPYEKSSYLDAVAHFFIIMLAVYGALSIMEDAESEYEKTNPKD